MQQVSDSIILPHYLLIDGGHIITFNVHHVLLLITSTLTYRREQMVFPLCIAERQ